MSSTNNLLHIATFNLRYDNRHDGANAWPHRREWVRDLIDYHQFGVVGVQEALIHQLEFLTEGRYASVGVGRNDGNRSGEFSAILYDRERFEALQSETFWLSETPDTPSMGWDAACIRICTWVLLKDKSTGRTFYHFNTHFDHQGAVAKERSAELLLQRIGAIAGANPFFLTGDFNMTPNDAPIKRIAAALHDSRAISEHKPYGPAGTFNNFDIRSSLAAPIDYIFVGNGVKVHTHGTLSDTWGQRYPSDHLPILIRAEIVPGE